MHELRHLLSAACCRLNDLITDVDIISLYIDLPIGSLIMVC